MSTRLLVKTSTVNATPLPSDLIDRELAFSFVSGGLFIKYPDGTVKQINEKFDGTISDIPGLASAINQKQDILTPNGGIVIQNGVISIDYNAIIGKPLLGNSSGLNVGITEGTVAEGNHRHDRADVGLGNVDNTSDANKPISIATQAALDGKQKVLTQGLNIIIDQNGVISSTGGTGNSIISWNAIQSKPTTFPPSTHTHTPSDVGLGNVNNTSDANKPISIATQAALDGKIETDSIGVIVASLDSTGKIPLAQLPGELGGALVYQGTWNAAVNSPPLTVANSTNKGYYYKVTVAGTTTLSGGHSTWATNDLVISNGTTWDKVQSISPVTSVANKFGVVTLVPSDVGLGNVNNTSDANKPISIATQAALDGKISSLSKGAVNGVASLDSTGKIPLAQLAANLASPLSCMGTWNASINNPVIPPATSSNKWNFYIVSNSGTTNINGISNWTTSDWIVSNGVSWFKVQTQNILTSVAGKTGDVVLGIQDITGLQSALNSAVGQVTSVAGKTGVVNLAISDITGLQAALQTGGQVTSVAGKNGVVTLVPSDVGLGNVNNTSDANKPISIATQAALDGKAANVEASSSNRGLMSTSDKFKLDSIANNATSNSSDATLLNRSNHTGTQSISTVTGLQASLDAKELSSNKNIANGYAGLDANGKVISTLLPDSVVGSLNYQGTWNAVSNTPSIPVASNLNKGFYYKVSVAGSTNINGIASWTIGDWIVSNGSVWERIQTTDTVTSVAGKSGTVVLVPSDVGLGNVNNTSDANKPISIATQAALDGKASSTLATSSVSGLLSFVDKAKLDSVANNATSNSSDFILLNRSNHTGTQSISTVTGLQASLDAKELSSNKGTPNGYAPLDENTKVPSAYLPSSLISSLAQLTDDVGIAKTQIQALNLVPQSTPDIVITGANSPVSGNLLADKRQGYQSTISVVDFTIYGVTFLANSTTTIQNGEILTGPYILENTTTPLALTSSTVTYSAGTQVTISGVGDITLNVNGDYTFSPAPSFSGSAPYIKYTVTDGVNQYKFVLVTLVQTSTSSILVSNVIGIGNSATMNVGTTSGTVAAGDDPRISNSIKVSGSSVSGPPTSGDFYVNDLYRDNSPLISGFMYWQCIQAGNGTAAVWSGMGNVTLQHIDSSFSPPQLNNNDTYTKTYNVPKTIEGDSVVAIFNTSSVLTGIGVSATTTNDTVTVVLSNNSGSTVTIQPGTMMVRVSK